MLDNQRKILLRQENLLMLFFMENNSKKNLRKLKILRMSNLKKRNKESKVIIKS
jgi:hypothetical protein